MDGTKKNQTGSARIAEMLEALKNVVKIYHERPDSWGKYIPVIDSIIEKAKGQENAGN